MNQTTSTTLLTLTEAAQACPRRISANSVWRWARKGIRARNGESVRLKHIRQGGQILIPDTALNEFFTTLAEADAEYFTPQQTIKPKVRRRGKRSAHDIAQEELRKEGLA